MNSVVEKGLKDVERDSKGTEAFLVLQLASARGQEIGCSCSCSQQRIFSNPNANESYNLKTYPSAQN